MLTFVVLKSQFKNMGSEVATSLLVSRTLDDLGYSQQLVKLRQLCWTIVGSAVPGYSEDTCLEVVGSKREGLTKCLESDLDIMCADLDILCTSTPSLYNHIKRLIVCHTERTNTAPGYTRFVYVKAGNTSSWNLINTALTEPISCKIYVSSDSWREQFTLNDDTVFMKNLRHHRAHGPSNPGSNKELDIHFDSVVAIICDCPEILQSWINRPRKHEWPSSDVIQEISSLEAHVVPVGFKGSDFMFLEWRICFTKAEIKLIHSLNDCQIKLLILLKTIAKSSLMPICKAMTTYVMKNIILWLSGIFPIDYFAEENLIPALQAALRFLRECLIARYLPSYMIPERNLLANGLMAGGRSRLSARTRLCAIIDIILAEGPCMLFRCKNIKNALIMRVTAPNTFMMCRQKISQLEALASLSSLYMLNFDVETINDLYEYLLNVVIPYLLRHVHLDNLLERKLMSFLFSKVFK